jgi:hypothetical protein
MKKNINYPLIILLFIGLAYAACKKEDSSEKFPPSTIASCSDGLLNQGEFKVDCGGPCDSCLLLPSLTAVVDSFWLPDTSKGDGFFGADVINGYVIGSSIEVIGQDTNTGLSIRFVHNKDLKRGVYFYDDIEGEVFSCDLLDGLVEITAFDKRYKTISGNFSFNCLGGTSGKKERVINGHFADVKFK